MHIPGDSQKLANFASELVGQCLVSLESRRLQARTWRSIFYTGSNGPQPSKYNRSYSHVDKLTSFLFSPAEVKFTVDFEGSGSKDWADIARSSSRYINRNFNRRGCGTTFSQANEMSLVEGCSIAKLTYGASGYQPWVIPQSFFGVYREDIADLNLQEAFTHSFYMTRPAFERLVARHPDREEILQRVAGSSVSRVDDEIGDSYFHEIVMGGISPLSVPGTQSANSGQQYGAVGITAPNQPMLAGDVAADLIRVDDLWVWDDDREDWTTIRQVDPGIIIEGKYKRRNCADMGKGIHPFVKVCSNEVPNYFWGRSELATIYEPQMLLSRLVNSIDSIFKLRASPPRAFSGFQNITEEKARAMLAPGGILTDPNGMAGKIESMAPELPPEALAWLSKVEDIFDDVGGFTAMLNGEGEPGVRAGVHAGVLLRTSTPRIRDRALLLEHQVAAFGDLCLKASQEKDAKIITGIEGTEFLLKQLPPDASVTVDSHTSSPAFSEDNKQLAFALAKAGVMDGESLIEAVHPPREDLLLDRYRAGQKAQAEWAAAHPVEAAEQSKRKR
jgi:hypothetical protein